jgi:hypothetical protein
MSQIAVLPSIVLPDDVALAVTIEIGDLLNVPAGARPHDNSPTDEVEPVHEP